MSREQLHSVDITISASGVEVKSIVGKQKSTKKYEDPASPLYKAKISIAKEIVNSEEKMNFYNGLTRIEGLAAVFTSLYLIYDLISDTAFQNNTDKNSLILLLAITGVYGLTKLAQDKNTVGWETKAQEYAALLNAEKNKAVQYHEDYLIRHKHIKIES